MSKQKIPPVSGPVTARLKINMEELTGLEDLSKEELIAIIREIRPDIEVPIWKNKPGPDEHGPFWGDKDGSIIGYMDKVDFDYELGGAAGGNKVYPSITNLQGCQPCTESCGIVEVEVKLRRVIRESDFSEDMAKAKRGVVIGKRTKKQKEEDAIRVKERQELHLTAAQLAVLPKKKALEILERARKDSARKEK